MLIQFCRAKIHRAAITDANLDYEGSLGIGRDLLAASGILPHEKVQLVNINNGARLETYVIEADDGSIVLNGAAARLGHRGDLVIIIAYAYGTEDEAKSIVPRVVTVDRNNRPVG